MDGAFRFSCYEDFGFGNSGVVFSKDLLGCITGLGSLDVENNVRVFPLELLDFFLCFDPYSLLLIYSKFWEKECQIGVKLVK